MLSLQTIMYLCLLVMVSMVTVHFGKPEHRKRPTEQGIGGEYLMKAEMSRYEAEALARQHGFVVQEQIFENYFVLKESESASRSAPSSSNLNLLRRNSKIEYLKREKYAQLYQRHGQHSLSVGDWDKGRFQGLQRGNRRWEVFRGPDRVNNIPVPDVFHNRPLTGGRPLRDIVKEHQAANGVTKDESDTNSKEIDAPDDNDAENDTNSSKESEEMPNEEGDPSRHNRAGKRPVRIDDFWWTEMWYIGNHFSPNMGVFNSWAHGYTGYGVVVAVLDDGIDTQHIDLQQNFRPELSYNYIDDTDDVHYVGEDKHGTYCAGVIASTKNEYCIPGIAYEVELSVVKRFKSGIKIPDHIDAKSLVHRLDTVDIYSNSWGPSDEGNIISGPSEIEITALYKGVTEGRGGKGAIYTFAAGNGGPNDDCNCDGYSNSPYTISINSIDADKQPTWYAEACTAILASTYPGTITTDVESTCRAEFYGTSSSCAVATGIIALLLESRPDLTWRDVQHLIVDTSSNEDLLCPLQDPDCIVTNGAGHKVSYYFGFGLMNATKLTEHAQTWTHVTSGLVDVTDVVICYTSNHNAPISQTYTVTDPVIDSLEHVRLQIKYRASIRGNVEFYLTSPMGTVSRLLRGRINDTKDMGNTSMVWTFMTVYSWGEDPTGNWTLTMRRADIGIDTDLSLDAWRLYLFGTSKDMDTETVSLDEPRVTKRSVPELLLTTRQECSFEEDQCIWRSKPTALPSDGTIADYGWVRTKRGFVDLPTDNQDSSQGYYMFASALNTTRWSPPARLVSADFANKAYCVQFSYKLTGGRHTLKLHVATRAMRKTIWRTSGRHDNTWYTGTMTAKLYDRSKYPLHFEFAADTTKSREGGIAVDNITVTPGKCDVVRV